MPSGTQGYQTTSGDSPLDKRLSQAIKDIPDFFTGTKNAFVKIDDDNLMITGATSDLLGPSQSDLVKPQDDFTGSGGGLTRIIDVLWTVVEEVEETNQLVEGQTRLLAASVEVQADALREQKRLRREERLEQTQDLSGTQTYGLLEGAKKGGGGGGLWDLIQGLGDAVRAFKWARRLLPSARMLPSASMLPPASSTKLLTGSAIPNANVRGTQNLLPSSNVTRLSKKEKLTNLINHPNTPINEREAAEKALKNLDGVTPNKGMFSGLQDTLKNLKMPEMPKIPDLGIAKFLSTPGVKNAIPLLSAVTGTMSLAEGDFAGAGVDYADAAIDTTLLAGGGGAAATGGSGIVGGVLAPAMTVIGTGLASSFVGEMTRGVGDWIRGDGSNQAKNVLGSLTDGLSGALEIVGTPFRALYEGANSLIKTGGFDESNKVMAEVDANIRESGRKFLNQFDFLNIVPDEVGGFGALGLYGDHADSAVQNLKDGKTGEGHDLNASDQPESPIKNAEGGSYIVDNPEITRGLMGGEAGKELVTFTPLGKSFRGGLHDALASAIEVPMKAAGGGIMAMAAKLPGFLGPLGDLVKPGIQKLLQPLANIFDMPNMTPSGGSSLAAFDQLKGHFENMFSGLTTGIRGLADKFLPSNLRNMLPFAQGEPPSPPAETRTSTRTNERLPGVAGGQLNLTAEDWEYITRAVQGEAGPDDDQYYVAASIINRMADARWGGAGASAKDIVTAEGQYEGYKPGEAMSREQFNRLTGQKGMAKIIEALMVLKGRTDFKGVSERHNMGATDILPNEKANFYHYLEEASGSHIQFDPSFERDDWKRYVNSDSLITKPPTPISAIQPTIQQNTNDTAMMLQAAGLSALANASKQTPAKPEAELGGSAWQPITDSNAIGLANLTMWSIGQR